MGTVGYLLLRVFLIFLRPVLNRLQDAVLLLCLREISPENISAENTLYQFAGEFPDPILGFETKATE